MSLAQACADVPASSAMRTSVSAAAGEAAGGPAEQQREVTHEPAVGANCAFTRWPVDRRALGRKVDDALDILTPRYRDVLDRLGQ